VTFRVSLHWQKPKTEANKREPTKESDDANLLTSCELCQKRSRLLGFLKVAVKTPCLPASSSLTSEPCHMAAVISIGRCPEIHAKRAESTANSLPIVNAVGFTASTTLANSAPR
jgi:hypothetical protein